MLVFINLGLLHHGICDSAPIKDCQVFCVRYVKTFNIIQNILSFG